MHESDCPNPTVLHEICPEPDESVCLLVSDVRNCSRCGGEHERLLASRFQRRVETPEAGGVLWTHWARCPTSGDPVLVSTTDRPGATLTPEVVEGLKSFADVAHGEGQVFPNPPLTGDRGPELAAVAWLKSRGWRPED